MGIHKTAIVSKKAEIDSSVNIGPGVIIEDDVIIGPDVTIMANAYICEGTDIGEKTQIHMGAVIGHVPQDHAYKGEKTFTKIGKNNVIREMVTIHRGTGEGTATIIGDDNFLMVQAHVGHNCDIKDNVIVANGALLAGHVHVEKGAFLSGNVVFHQFCKIGQYAMIGGFTGVNKDVPPYMIVRGPSVIRGINLVGLRRAGLKLETVREIKEAYKIFYLSDMNKEEALSKIKKELKSEQVKYFVDFIEQSKRGVCNIRFSKEEYF